MQTKNILILLALLLILFLTLLGLRLFKPEFTCWPYCGRLSNQPVACTMDARICPDGTAVGRQGPNCEFAPCPDPKSDAKIRSLNITSGQTISSPLVIRGKARGSWFFEGSFPILLVNWDGLIIAEAIAQAEGEWMTEDFVPFRAELFFTKPENPTNQNYARRGAIIFKRDNPSGLPEHDDAYELSINF